MTELRKENKELHYNDKTYYLKLDSELLPFSIRKGKFKQLESANEELQKFVRYIEKKFDKIWYIGVDYFGDDLYERFMFHHGGFMEISLRGEIRVYLTENKLEKLKKAIVYAISKLSNLGSAKHIIKHAKSGERLISLGDSLK